MNATLRMMLAIAAGLLLMAGQLWAEEGKQPSPEQTAKILAEAGTPGPEHEKLANLAGEWTYTCKFWMDPSQPPIETKGTVERKPILGGRFLEETYEGTGFDGKPGFEGRNLLGYDNSQKKYTSSFVCSMGTGIATGLGESDSAGTLTYKTEAYCPLRKTTVHGRDVIRIEGPDKVVMESYMNEGGKEVKMMELVSVRK